MTDNENTTHSPSAPSSANLIPPNNFAIEDEGGLRAPPDLHGWRKAWWWFHFLILVKLARLRFIAILVVIGLAITQWDTLVAYYDRWTRPADSQTAAHADSDIEYFCPMHPSIVRDNNKEPCPICHMPLSKRKKGDSHTTPLPAGVVNRVQLSPYRVVLAGVQTWPVDYVPLTKQISAVGYVEFNERGQRTVAARAAGRIDRLFANETGQMVKAGDDLALLYSPNLLVSMQNLLDGKKRGSQDAIDSTRMRLKLLGVDDDQIDQALASGTADTHVRIRSPISGHVITKFVQEGQYVQEGAPLYEIADLSTVWIQAQVYEYDLPFLPAASTHDSRDAPGMSRLDVTATTRSVADEVFHGKLAFIYPHVDQNSRTATVRFELDNPGHKLRPGSTADVVLKVQPQDLPWLANNSAGDPRHQEMLDQGRVLAVPESAVIDTGTQRIVYRETTPGVYEGVDLNLGPRMTSADGAPFYPVLAGLQPGERIVSSGSFLIDAETRLNPAAGSIYFGGSGSKKSDAVTSNVRPSTPLEPADTSAAAPPVPLETGDAVPTAAAPDEAAIQTALAKLSPDDRALALAQRECPITHNRLGVMGPPLKIELENQVFFLCCAGCKDEALKDPSKTLAKVNELNHDNQLTK